MSDTGSPRHHPPRAPHHRPPPLLVIAATGLAVVLAVGITLVLLRVRGGDASSDQHAAAARSIAEPPEPSRPAVIAPAAPAAHERREPLPASARAAMPPAEAPPTDVPEWERKPLRTTQPFPEEARFDPPMAPIKIPPEMLVPLGARDGAATP